MMSITDIIQLVVLCALIFFPLGYLSRHFWKKIETNLRLMFFRPRYLKPAGILRRPASLKARQKDE